VLLLKLKLRKKLKLRRQHSLPKVLLPRTKRQQYQLLSQSQSKLLEVDDSEGDSADEIDFHVAYRRPELVKVKYNLLDDDEELPKHITDRLAQARAMALEKYREVYG
jgi:hypothetical protein